MTEYKNERKKITVKTRSHHFIAAQILNVKKGNRIGVKHNHKPNQFLSSCANYYTMEPLLCGEELKYMNQTKSVQPQSIKQTLFLVVFKF